MLKITMTIGIPASGKSTWAKEEVAKAPEKITRINRDDLRNMMSNYHFSDANEKLVTSAKNFMIQQALRYGHDVIIDETNLNRRNFDDVCKLVREMNINCMVLEKPFFIELDEAIARDSRRAGTSQVGEDVVRKFWKKSGGNQHKHYKGRVSIIQRQTEASMTATMVEADPSKQNAIMVDLDGTISLFNCRKSDGSIDVRHANAHTRSPYDASKCDKDTVNKPVAEVVEQMNKAGYKIIFCSGREDCYREQTVRFIEKHLNIPYELHMRKSNDMRKDSIIKGEIYDSVIAPNYNVFFILDDRTSVINFWRSRGLNAWQVAPGNF